MSKFYLSVEHLETLMTSNSFNVGDGEMVFVGLRGCGAVEANHKPASSVQLFSQEPNHLQPKCVILQWNRKKNEVAAFPASTVPHLRYMKRHLSGASRANQLFTGLHLDYKKGIHNASKSTGHAAFRQTGIRPVLRSNDDLEYENTDEVDLTNPYDNLHAAWCTGTNGNFSSAGCQVVVGLPKCEKRGDKSAVGPWATFVREAYKIATNKFAYALLKGADAKAASLGAPLARLRFGSSGTKVRDLQAALGFSGGNVDSKFGPKTLLAVLDFQRESGLDPDGVVGPKTLTKL